MCVYVNDVAAIQAVCTINLLKCNVGGGNRTCVTAAANTHVPATEPAQALRITLNAGLAGTETPTFTIQLVGGLLGDNF